jgi:hypothetical protein
MDVAQATRIDRLSSHKTRRSCCTADFECRQAVRGRTSNPRFIAAGWEDLPSRVIASSALADSRLALNENRGAPPPAVIARRAATKQSLERYASSKRSQRRWVSRDDKCQAPTMHRCLFASPAIGNCKQRRAAPIRAAFQRTRSKSQIDCPRASVKGHVGHGWRGLLKVSIGVG